MGLLLKRIWIYFFIALKKDYKTGYILNGCGLEITVFQLLKILPKSLCLFLTVVSFYHKLKCYKKSKLADCLMRSHVHSFFWWNRRCVGLNIDFVCFSVDSYSGYKQNKYIGVAN